MTRLSRILLAALALLPSVALAHSHLAHTTICRGMARLDADEARIEADLAERWELLAEPIQTVMRRYGIENPYEKLKELTRGRRIDADKLATFIDTLEIPEEAKAQLKAMSPANYIGNAVAQAKKI